MNNDKIRATMQEWFCDCTTEIEVAELYAELYHEIKRSMEERMVAVLEAGEE